MVGLKILLSWASLTFLLSSGVLFMRRRSGDRSRLFLAWVWLFAGLAFLCRLLAPAFDQPIVNQVLPVTNMGGGLWAIVFLYLYPLEAIGNGWLTRRNMLLFLMPGLVLGVILWFMKPYARELTSFADIWTYIGEFNVWFRLAALILGVSFYAVFLYYIPYNWMKSTVYHSWIVLYSVKIQLISVCFVLFMLTGLAWVSSIHLLVCMAVAVTVTYRELFIRFEVRCTEDPQQESDKSDVLPDLVADVEPTDPLIERRRRLMDDDQIWRNPDIDLPYLAQELNTNRSYLSKAIQDDGYKNFADMINRKRIAEFLKLADAGSVVSVQDTFFYVGFRSRETALRCFKKYVGVSPTDYLRSRMAYHTLQTE